MTQNRPLTEYEKQKLSSFIDELDKHIGLGHGLEKIEFLHAEENRLKSLLLEKSPDVDVTGTLFSGGTPFDRARQFLNSKNQSTTRNHGSSWFKWLVIGIVSLFGLACATLIVLLIFFTPIVDISPTGGVRFFGGAITIDESQFQIYQNGQILKFQSNNQGLLDVQEGVTQLGFEFNNGTLRLEPSPEEDAISWQCSVLISGNSSGETYLPTTDFGQERMTVKLTQAKGLRCNIRYPDSMESVSVQGNNGQVNLTNSKVHLDVSLNNGTVDLTPADKANYDWDLKVENGMIMGAEPALESLPQLKGKIRLNNGQITIH